jgi:hypothetical protein
MRATTSHKLFYIWKWVQDGSFSAYTWRLIGSRFVAHFSIRMAQLRDSLFRPSGMNGRARMPVRFRDLGRRDFRSFGMQRRFKLLSGDAR